MSKILTKKNAYDDLKIFFKCEFSSSVKTAATEIEIEASKSAFGKTSAIGEWGSSFKLQYFNKDFTTEKSISTATEDLYLKASWTISSAALSSKLRNVQNKSLSSMLTFVHLYTRLRKILFTTIGNLLALVNQNRL